MLNKETLRLLLDSLAPASAAVRSAVADNLAESLPTVGAVASMRASLDGVEAGPEQAAESVLNVAMRRATEGALFAVFGVKTRAEVEALPIEEASRRFLTAAQRLEGNN